MGQNQSNSSNDAKTAKDHKPQESDESDDDGMPELSNEADPFIIMNVVFKKPDGTSEQKEFRVSTNKKLTQVKRDLEQKFNITANRIRVYLENGQAEMPDECTFHDLGIVNDINLIAYDGSKTYDFEYE